MTDGEKFLNSILSGCHYYINAHAGLHNLKKLDLPTRLYHIYSYIRLYEKLPDSVAAEMESEICFLRKCIVKKISKEGRLAAYQELQAEEIAKKRNKKIDIIISHD